MGNNIIDIIEGKLCCGCGVCINTCPTAALKYSKDREYFLIPEIDLKKCILCGKCRTVCPSLVNKLNSPQKVFAAVNCNKEVLVNSSSGGIFYSIASLILDRDGVVYGTEMTSDFQVQCARIDNIKDLPRLQKSKYVQSFMGATYESISKDLRAGKSVLFSGTPCQVSAVKNYVGPLDQRKLLTVDVVCHGVPSQDLFDDYIGYLGKKRGKVKTFQFRAKKNASNNMNWFFSFQTIRMKKNSIRNWTEDSYNYNYMMGNVYRESCYSCQYARQERASDITLCDFWHWDASLKEQFDKNDSVSGILINTEKGDMFMEMIKKNLKMANSHFNDVAAHNSCLVEPCKRPQIRDHILKLWIDRGYEAIDNEFVNQNKLEIFKGIIRRHIPSWIYMFLAKVKGKIL